jgi:exonuclease III
MQVQAGRDGRQRPLMLLTHNVQGITTAEKAYKCVSAWHRAGAHVVCVQETWVDRIHQQGKSQAEVELWLQQAAARLQMNDMQVWFANNTLASQHRAGVAIVLLHSHVLLEQVQVDIKSATPDGRLIACDLQWAGHHFTILNTYWPPDHEQRSTFLTDALTPTLASVRRDRLLLAGDFNFVEDARLDRTRLADGAVLNSSRTQEQELAVNMATALQDNDHDMLDIYRHLHPHSCRFTRYQRPSASRIDRWYVPIASLPHVLQADITCRETGSDHFPPNLLIAPKSLTKQRGRGSWRASISFLQEDQRERTLAEWAGTMVRDGLAMPPHALLSWWPKLKDDYKVQIKAQMVEYAQQVSAQPSERAAEQVMQAAMEEVWEAGERAQPEQFQRAQEARAQAAHTVHTSAAYAAAAERAQWLHQRETPGPALTRLMRPPKQGMRMTALVDATGNMITEPQKLADTVAKHFAGVSHRRQVTQVAQQQVLAAIAQQQQQGIKPEHAASAGRPIVDEAEVRWALGRLPRGRTPGTDGLPLEVWTIGDGVWAPLLAKLFTAIGEGHVKPPDFSLGCVVPIHKGGEVTQVSRYRPITLLNADYKILARVLANRYAHAMQGAIGREQTAFLPGREIGDNIAFTQLLAAALDAEDMPAGLVSLDIEQAYDSVDREALYAIMQAKGADDGMIRWVRTLLDDTKATARVSGWVSRPRCWEAGVRQGCPLSPLLYLFVAEALACWLRQSDRVGVQVQGVRHVSAQHADDTKVVLSSLDGDLVDHLLDHVTTFTAATGQRVNANKSCAIPLGALQLDAPNQTTAVPVSDTIVCLGIAVAPVPTQELELTRHGLRQEVRDPPPAPRQQAESPTWDRRLRTVRTLCNRVSSLSLSAMGRGMAVSSYVASKLCYHAEFEGIPKRYEDEIVRALAGTTDGRRQGLRGVHTNMLPGSPSVGGFGLLPLHQHIAGRHIKWASRLLSHLVKPEPADDEDEQPPSPPPPSWVPIATALLQRVCPTLHPVQTMLLSAWSTHEHALLGRLTGVNAQRLLIPDGPLRRMFVALQEMGALHFPPDAHAHVDAHAWLQDIQSLADIQRLAPSLVWHSQLGGRTADALSPCRPISVKVATMFMREPDEARRQQLHAAYAEQAFQGSGLSPASRASRTRCFVRGWRSVWRVPWENRHKEVLWRLAVNGAAGAGGCDICLDRPCVCGAVVITPAQVAARNSTPLRLHAFWDCPVAQAVVQQLRRGLGNRPLARWNVWLLQPPPGVRSAVWKVVALAALEAMEMGRRALWREWVRRGRPQDEEDVAERAAAVHVARQRAASCFWLSLHDFAHGGRHIEGSGWDGVDADHPFLAVQVAPPARPAIRVVLPAN